MPHFGPHPKYANFQGPWTSVLSPPPPAQESPKSETPTQTNTRPPLRNGHMPMYVGSLRADQGILPDGPSEAKNRVFGATWPFHVVWTSRVVSYVRSPRTAHGLPILLVPIGVQRMSSPRVSTPRPPVDLGWLARIRLVGGPTRAPTYTPSFGAIPWPIPQTPPPLATRSTEAHELGPSSPRGPIAYGPIAPSHSPSGS